MQRRSFLKWCTRGLLASATAPLVLRAYSEMAPNSDGTDEQLLHLIDSNRPSKLVRLPEDFQARIGAAHVAGKYCFSNQPFLLEGADKLLELGTRLGKFWFMPKNAARDYPFNSKWGQYETLLDLAKSDYFQELFARPLSTFLLETHSASESHWRSERSVDYETITREFYELTAHLYRNYRTRPVTFVLQHWEGDWMLRGRGGETWKNPPADWPKLCERMQNWLRARQAGVSKARAEHGTGAVCKVAHATEVNRVADIWKGIPTVTDQVLPHIEVDLVSYSSYDALKDPLLLWKCIQEIKKHARTTDLFGKAAFCIGEVGIPENEQPNQIPERWDRLMGVALAANARYVAHWELYCNELNPKLKPAPKIPVKNLNEVRGFWLVRPDGKLGESGNYFHELWKRAAAEKSKASLPLMGGKTG